MHLPNGMESKDINNVVHSLISIEYTGINDHVWLQCIIKRTPKSFHIDIQSRRVPICIKYLLM